MSISLAQLDDPIVMEPFIDAQAKSLAKKLRYRDDVFSVHLVSRLDRGYMSIVPGSPIKILLMWPHAYAQLNTNLRSAFATIKKHNLYQPFAVATHAYFQTEREHSKRWVKQKLGSDLADTLASLIPKHRLVTTITTTVQVKDNITGTLLEETLVTVSDHRDAPFHMWSRVSQIVFAKHPETVDFVEIAETVVQSETPLLDAAKVDEQSDNGLDQ